MPLLSALDRQTEAISDTVDPTEFEIDDVAGTKSTGYDTPGTTGAGASFGDRCR